MEQRLNILNFLIGALTSKDEDDLGRGFKLVPTKVKMYKGDTNTYSQLYKDDKKVSKELFRKGGLSSGFKGDYCPLIHYKKTTEKYSLHCKLGRADSVYE